MSDGVRVAVDIGGTFTDVVAVDDGNLVTEKVPSTPDAPADAVTTGVTAVGADAGFDPGDVSFLAHGTTVATNAVLERDWASAGLLTTAGFRDVLEIGRQTRPDIYDFDAEKPDPVIPRHRRLEVEERVDERGNVIDPLDEEEVRDTADAFGDVDSVAVCLLFAYEHPDHERRAGEILREELDVPVSVSSTVLPEIREYERSLTTALNAALQPVVTDYLEALRGDLDAVGVVADLTIMGSSGGILTADTAGERPVATLLSGPAAGVQGAAHVADTAGISEVVTMDMGGTSCDVSLVTDGEPSVTTEGHVGDYPVAVEMVDVHTVGAGGGSVAWLDAGDALRVGPRSAGAAPGPVCYGRGGDRPTTTDAQVVLGRIDPTNLLASPAPRDRVGAVIDRDIGDEMGASVPEAAAGIVSVADANMERALRVVSVERGHDPRSLSLVAYGGAGPLHAASMAAALDMPRVLVPPSAGVLSALGLLVSDVAADESMSMVRSWSAVDATTIDDAFDSLQEQAATRLADAGVGPGDQSYEYVVDVRYAGQSFDLPVTVEPPIDEATLDAVPDRFHDRHADRYGHAATDEPIELVTLRVRGRGDVPTPRIDPAQRPESVTAAVRETRPVYFDDGFLDTRVYDRTRLPVSATVDGPAVVESPQSTALVHPDQAATVDDTGNLIIDIDP